MKNDALIDIAWGGFKMGCRFFLCPLTYCNDSNIDVDSLSVMIFWGGLDGSCIESFLHT